MSAANDGAAPAASAAPGMSAAPEWSAAERATLRAAFRAGRLPHALLIHEAPGAGGEWLATWAAQLVLCREPARAPCGACTGCRRVWALQHPDVTWLRATEESRQIRIEQVRDLAAELALTAHGGGYKVGIVSPADALNRFAANALLKTLEEPPPGTLLVLTATQPSRLPPTLISRCQRLRVRAPTRAEGIAWLTALRGTGEWGEALEVLGDAPLLLARAEPREIAQTGLDAHRTLDALAEGTADPVAEAERWARGEALPLRLRCFENWLTDQIRRRTPGAAPITEVRAGPYLPAGGVDLNIRELFGLLDEVRELRATLDVPLNRGLALEALFRRLTRQGAPS